MKSKVMAAVAAIAPLLLVSGCSISASGIELGSGPPDFQLHASSAAGDIPVDPAARALLPASIRNSGILRVGGQTSQPPYLQTENGDVTGLESDFIVSVARTLGLEPKMTNTKFVSLVPGLASERFDVVMGNFSDTLVRQQSVDFIDYAASRQTFVVRTDSGTQVSTLDDLCGRSVAGAIGAKSIMLMHDQSVKCEEAGKRPLEIKTFPSFADATLALLNGRVEVIPIDYGLARALVRGTDGKLEIIESFYGQGLIGVGVRKGESDLADAMRAAFSTLMENGTYRRILDHWELQGMSIPEPVVNGVRK
jgi:polar amino acid transport system substrate-binding protein